MYEEQRVEMVNLTPTMRCNLKCKLCGVLVPHYSYCPQMSRDELADSLKAVFEIIDYIKKLQITGGEPFMYPYLCEAMEECFKYSDKFDKLWILTNGTIPIKKEILEFIKTHKDKIYVHISDYGVKQDVTNKIIEQLKQIGCDYRYLKYYGSQQYYDGWVDQGDFTEHARSKEELKHIFQKCPHVCRGGSWYVRNGEMHWCGRSIRGKELGKVALDKKEYLNIFEGTVEERRKRFKELQSLAYITACDYCNGNYGTTQNEKRYPAGEQM